MRKRLVSLGLIGSLLFTSSAQAFPFAIPAIPFLAGTAGCIAKKALTFIATSVIEDKIIESIASEVLGLIEDLTYDMVVNGRFGYSGHDRNIKGIIGEKIAEIFLEKASRNDRFAEYIGDVLGLDTDSVKNLQILTYSKQVNNSGFDVLACSDSDIYFVEVKFGSAILSARQKDSGYLSRNIRIYKESIDYSCPTITSENVHTLLFRVNHVDTSTYRITICPLYKSGYCRSVSFKLSYWERRKVQRAVSREALKIIIKSKFNLSEEQIRRISKLLRYIDPMDLEELKELVGKLTNTLRLIKLVRFTPC